MYGLSFPYTHQLSLHLNFVYEHTSEHIVNYPCFVNLSWRLLRIHKHPSDCHMYLFPYKFKNGLTP